MKSCGLCRYYRRLEEDGRHVCCCRVSDWCWIDRKWNDEGCNKYERKKLDGKYDTEEQKRDLF